MIHISNGDFMLIISLKIFLARMIDVTLGTVRTMFIVKGSRVVASIIAFIEVLIWFYASKSIFSGEFNNVMLIMFYALGYGVGTFIGTLINDFFIDGIFNIQVISSNMSDRDVRFIKFNRFGVTELESVDKKKVLLLEVEKKRYRECISLLRKLDNKAFIIVNDSKLVFNGFVGKKNTFLKCLFRF